jgi:hypothetical protein
MCYFIILPLYLPAVAAGKHEKPVITIIMHYRTGLSVTYVETEGISKSYLTIFKLQIFSRVSLRPAITS